MHIELEALLPAVQAIDNIEDPHYDALVVIGDLEFHKKFHHEGTKEAITHFMQKIDQSKEVKVIPCKYQVPGERIIYSPTGSVTGDFDDVRNFQEAAIKATKKALSAGSKAPLFMLPHNAKFVYCEKVSLLAILHALYTPLEVREHKGNAAFKKIEKIGILSTEIDKTKKIIREALALEMGRIVARDIGGSDPERMAAPKVAEYVRAIFKARHNVKLTVVHDVKVFEKSYPLLAAVNRCTKKERHAGQIIKLEYVGEGPIEQTLLLVGKGITYDTGGADIKAGGVMAGMHRDKCGAAAVAGFFQLLSVYQPKHLKVIGAMAMVRNGVGSNCYVSDEIIVSRAGVRVRVGNTDAEGRMVMSDLLCEMKEIAMDEFKPFLFTFATLTGHVIRAFGPNYSSVISNGPARKEKISQIISIAGEKIGEPCEVTRLRKEDFKFNEPPSEYEDVVQANSLPSTMTPRGHQYPAAFMMTASGLDKCGSDSSHALPYTHIDVAGSSGPYPGIPTGAPLQAMAEAFVFNFYRSHVTY